MNRLRVGDLATVDGTCYVWSEASGYASEKVFRGERVTSERRDLRVITRNGFIGNIYEDILK